MKAYGVQVGLHPAAGHWIKFSGQIHATSVLTSGKSFPISIEEEAKWTLE
jgi:hypothetical protein